MKIIVAYATAGAGHKKAASVIYSHLVKEIPSATVELVDILDYSSPFFRFIYLRGYDFLVNHCKWAWAFLFYASQKRSFDGVLGGLTSFVHSANSRGFSRLLVDRGPDIVISTHFLCSDVVSCLKQKKIVDCKLITVITDFGVHPFWITSGTDYYCVACEETRSTLLSRGVSSLSVRVTGIPVHPRFAKKHDRRSLERSAGIDPRKWTVLIITGSFGIGPIEALVRELSDEYNVLAVCAKNKKLYSKLKARSFPNTNVYGFIDNVDELMAVSDVIITKPGGLTISELLCLDCLPLFISAIPGQEFVNACILERAGVAGTIRRVKDAKKSVAGAIFSAESIRKAASGMKKPAAVESILDVIRKNCAGSSG